MAFPEHSSVTRTVDVSDGFGSVSIEPAGEVVAGSFGTWRLTYTAGTRGVAVGGSLRIRTDSDTDRGVPQFSDPAAAEYMTLAAPDGVRCSVQVGGPKSLVLRIHGHPLESGEQIRLTLGETGGGGPGSRAQTFIEARHNFLIEVDAEGNGRRVILAESPHLTIVGGPAERLVVVAPSNVVVGQPFRVLIKAEDCWGNPSSDFRGTVELEGDGLAMPSGGVRFEPRNGALPLERGVRSIEGLLATTTGVLRLRAIDRDSGLTARSNPVIAAESAGDFRLHWADPHGGQISDSSKIGDFFQYARNVSGIQFVGHQRNADVISKDDWVVQQRQEREFHEPGRFIPIPGFEWSGRTPEGGHHNVYFRRHDQPVRRNPPSEVAQSVDVETELPHIRDVYHAYRNTDTIITPHVGGEHSSLAWHDPTLEPAMEITSSHGSFEWAIREILERGYQLGFLGGSDCYTGRPGDDRPGHQMRRYARSGLTGIYTRELTLDGFFEAMRARRVYATTGARIVLRLESSGHLLGSKYTTSDPPRLKVHVAGTAPLESLDVFRGLEHVYTYPLATRPIPNRVRILWDGASRMSSYSGIVWDGTLNVEGAAIESVDSLRFDSPRSFFTIQDAHETKSHLTWHAWGCGYPMGLVLDLNGTAATLRIAVASRTITGPIYGGHREKGPLRRISFAPADNLSLTVGLRELQDGAVDVPLGVLDRRLGVSLAAEPGPETAGFEFTDDSPAPGINAYWIRVRQSDQHLAWSSPVYVDFTGGGS